MRKRIRELRARRSRFSSLVFSWKRRALQFDIVAADSPARSNGRFSKKIGTRNDGGYRRARICRRRSRSYNSVATLAQSEFVVILVCSVSARCVSRYRRKHPKWKDVHEMWTNDDQNERGDRQREDIAYRKR